MHHSSREYITRKMLRSRNRRVVERYAILVMVDKIHHPRAVEAVAEEFHLSIHETLNIIIAGTRKR